MEFGITFGVLFLCCGFAVLAGMVKGITGFAMPMILISSLGSFLSPELALAGLILPTLVTNLWQAIRNGWQAAWASAKEHRRFLAISLICLCLSAQLVTLMPDTVLFLMIGVPVTAFAVLQLVGWRPSVPPEKRKRVELGVGAFAGSIGGFSGVWGPPTVLYLTALNVPKVEHVRVQGVVYSSGAVALTLAHLNSGVLNAPGLALSALLILPAVAGMALGMIIQARLDQEKFRLAILIVLTLAGLNLVRRALFG